MSGDNAEVLADFNNAGIALVLAIRHLSSDELRVVRHDVREAYWAVMDECERRWVHGIEP